jgi:DNA-binding PadR family transcriptional regulator
MQREGRRHGHGRHEMSRRRGYSGKGRHKVRRGDVRSAVLALLDDRAMHGYEMITELEERTAGRWRPSAGSIYPTLQLLEDEGLVTAEEVDGRRVYSLTDDGQKAAPERTGEARPWEEADDDSSRYAIRKELYRTVGAAKNVAAADDEEQMAKAADILKETRRKLYGLLAEE